MNHNHNPYHFIIKLLLRAIVLLLLIVISLCLYISIYTQRKPSPPKTYEPYEQAIIPEVVKDTTHYWQAPDTNTLVNSPDKKMVLYGRDIIINTSKYFGTQGIVQCNAINALNCQNCHLDAGTKIFGNNYGSVAATYPKYRARSGGLEPIYKRVNDCFERSLNGKPLDTASLEMKAIIAYIKWLGKDVTKGKAATGAGLKEIELLDRPANPELGKQVYINQCQSCHQSSGEGVITADKSGYIYPPLWGAKSYNDGAGLYRISNFAKYVKYNMPYGIHYDAPQLTDEEAWDVAAFVNAQPRPHKSQLQDWPKLWEKPMDFPFGPYADTFNEKEHKFGPYKIIKAAADSIKKQKSNH